MRDLTYPPVVWTSKRLFSLLRLKFNLRGTEHIPTEGGALLAINHISYIDFVLAGLAAQPSKRLVRFMAKREAFDHKISGPVMRSMHHISVDRGEGLGSYREAVRYLREGEVVGIFPEATISRSFEIKPLKTGAVRLAAEANVPLIPVILWGTQRLITKGQPRDLSRSGKTINIFVGEPMYPTSDNATQDTAELTERMRTLLDEAISAYPADEQPPGSWWLPKRLGGSAPTIDEAKELEVQERAARIAKKRAKKK